VNNASSLPTLITQNKTIYILSKGPNGPRAWQVLDQEYVNDTLYCKLKDLTRETASYLWELPGQQAKRNNRNSLLIHLVSDWLPDGNWVLVKDITKVIEIKPNGGMILLKSVTLATITVVGLYLLTGASLFHTN
jgi:hypothetical protein